MIIIPTISACNAIVGIINILDFCTDKALFTMKKYLMISVIIHTLSILAIVYGGLKKDNLKPSYEFEVTIDAYNFNDEIIISEKSIAKTEAEKKKIENDSDNLDIEKDKNSNIEQKKKNNKGKKNSEDVLSKEQEYYIDIINGKIKGYNLPMPKYPPVAKKWGYMGTTIVEITINTFGKVEDIKVKKSSGYSILDRSVVSTIRNKWKNLPKPGKKIVISKAFEFEIVD
jgi:TonB family protein